MSGAGRGRTPAGIAWIAPDWPAPPGVRAAFSLRSGGVSAAPFDSLNLAGHVGDDPNAVRENRRRLRGALALPAEPTWLEQVHGVEVLDADRAHAARPRADAALTRVPGRVLAVLVADCIAVLLADADGGVIAVAHAGWRGLAAGVLDAAVAALGPRAGALHAWLSPAIGAAHFEVGAEVREAFCRDDARAADAFAANARGRWQCDLRRLARERLGRLGVRSVHGEERCTYAGAGQFYSYRREARTGRMAALIWLEGR